MMGEAYFHDGRVVNRETNRLSNIYMVLLIVFVLLIFPRIIVSMASLPGHYPHHHIACYVLGWNSINCFITAS